jgi:hypothetical protein
MKESFVWFRTCQGGTSPGHLAIRRRQGAADLDPVVREAVLGLKEENLIRAVEIHVGRH